MINYGYIHLWDNDSWMCHVHWVTADINHVLIGLSSATKFLCSLQWLYPRYHPTNNQTSPTAGMGSYQLTYPWRTWPLKWWAPARHESLPIYTIENGSVSRRQAQMQNPILNRLCQPKMLPQRLSAAKPLRCKGGCDVSSWVIAVKLASGSVNFLAISALHYKLFPLNLLWVIDTSNFGQWFQFYWYWKFSE